MDGNSIIEDLKRQLQRGDMIINLIAINVAVFITLGVLRVLLFLLKLADPYYQLVVNYLMIPADVMNLLFKPWTVITHMFTHTGLWHILFNMLWLYWFGRILQEFLGNRKILPVYIYGGLVGAFFFVLSYNIFPGLQGAVGAAQALGASAGVMAIIVAAATMVPEYTIYLLFLGPVKLKWIALVLIVIDLISVAGTNAGGHLAHLGGATFGYFFISQLRNGNDWSVGFNNLFDSIKGAFTGKSGPKVAYKQRNSGKRSRGYGYTKRDMEEPENGSASRDNQKKLDEILDKISKSGYDSLTKEEKHFLFHVSKNDDSEKER